VTNGWLMATLTIVAIHRLIEPFACVTEPAERVPAQRQ
jgi:hypothetical protein